LRARDAASHQGTMWGWRPARFADAWLKVHRQDSRAIQRLVEGFTRRLGEACIGSISEVFDARQPFTPRGCVAQAGSVAEVLRILVKVRTPAWPSASSSSSSSSSPPPGSA
jgi:glycogen debranching enzyme